MERAAGLRGDLRRARATGTWFVRRQRGSVLRRRARPALTALVAARLAIGLSWGRLRRISATSRSALWLRLSVADGFDGGGPWSHNFSWPTTGEASTAWRHFEVVLGGDSDALVFLFVAGGLFGRQEALFHGFGARELSMIRRIIAAHRAAILEAWHEHCG